MTTTKDTLKYRTAQLKDIQALHGYKIKLEKAEQE